VGYLLGLKQPLKAIAISHPHVGPNSPGCVLLRHRLPDTCYLLPATCSLRPFARCPSLIARPIQAPDASQFFASSLTWSRALRVPLYLCEADNRWFQRLSDIRPEDKVEWWSGEAILGQGVKVVQCGG
jgi:hypothetical protein